MGGSSTAPARPHLTAAAAAAPVAPGTAAATAWRCCPPRAASHLLGLLLPTLLLHACPFLASPVCYPLCLELRVWLDPPPLPLALRPFHPPVAPVPTARAVLCCAVLCCAGLVCAVLFCAVLCCAVLCCAVLCCAVLCCAVLCFLVCAVLALSSQAGPCPPLAPVPTALLCCAVLCCAVQAGQRRPVHHRAARRLRHRVWGEGGAAERGAEAAHRHCACAGEAPHRAAPRRGDVGWVGGWVGGAAVVGLARGWCARLVCAAGCVCVWPRRWHAGTAAWRYAASGPGTGWALPGAPAPLSPLSPPRPALLSSPPLLLRVTPFHGQPTPVCSLDCQPTPTCSLDCQPTPAPMLALPPLPPAALDADSEAVVQEALDRTMKNRTVLVIAHRLSTIQDAHRIVVIQHGAVAEVGAHEQLVERGGVYAGEWGPRSCRSGCWAACVCPPPSHTSLCLAGFACLQRSPPFSHVPPPPPPLPLHAGLVRRQLARGPSSSALASSSSVGLLSSASAATFR